MLATLFFNGKQRLLVEGDEVFRGATAAMLRSAGYAVGMCGSLALRKRHAQHNG
jgi:hypothetical protein